MVEPGYLDIANLPDAAKTALREILESSNHKVITNSVLNRLSTPANQVEQQKLIQFTKYLDERRKQDGFSILSKLFEHY